MHQTNTLNCKRPFPHKHHPAFSRAHSLTALCLQLGYIAFWGSTFSSYTFLVVGVSMACELKKWLVGFVLMLNWACGVLAEPQVPCYFIFGDSLVDNGNNNGIASLARANYLPYGIDFPAGPTGRFSNGKTTVDVIAGLLGFDDYIPPYATARGEDILKGVNYASAAAGIRDETGQQLGARISFNGQLRNYQNTVSQVIDLLGNEGEAANYLSRCIFSVGLGSNDYLNNYFMPQYYSTSRRYTPEQYADVLIQQYSQQLRTLYNYGARKVALIGVGQIGCSPNALAQNSPDGRTCVQRFNYANRLFNDRLKGLVDRLNNNFADARFIYINAYGIFQDLINNPAAFGFRVTNAGCCGVGRNNGQITCLPLQTPCPNRKEYLFWDAFHPGDAANIIIGRRSYSAQKSSDAYPIDIRLCILNFPSYVHGEPQVPCFFIFGDSLVDNGNNNLLPTIAKANFLPNGIDFKYGPTGRFCNGRNQADILAELLGFDNYIPPYVAAIGQEILKGINYASGGAGIRRETGQNLGGRIPLDMQLENHQITVSRITNILGSTNVAKTYLGKCFYYVGMGSNDYINNYFMPESYSTSRMYTPEEYASVLIQQYSQQIKILYGYGARKVALFGLGPIGCIPNMLAKYNTDGSCVNDVNAAVMLFNDKLKALVDELNNEFVDAKFIFVNVFGIGSTGSSSEGFIVTNIACCGTGEYKGEIPCLPAQIPCQNRTDYVFWDPYHPTEHSNVVLATRSYDAQLPSDAYPYDIHQLVQQ
ncbi:GDSL lipase/esterase [Dillenia turbinata]|uniref:GDSL lipase/esterase n=1 Tax=Dillenia turbinata TaxID=194707 RepID=A0AAN8VNH5_9MAGN